MRSISMRGGVGNPPADKIVVHPVINKTADITLRVSNRLFYL